MIMCVLLCYPVSIRIYYQQGVLFLVFVNFHLPLKRKRHICLRFGNLLNLAKESGRSPPGKHLMPRYFNIDRYGRQKYGLISIYIFVFDTNTSARCRDKGKGKEPCVSDPQTSDCQICNSLRSEQHQQLSTPSYKLKKEKREAKLADSTPSQDSDQLVDPSSVSVIGVVDGQGSVKSPAPVPPPDKKP